MLASAVVVAGHKTTLVAARIVAERSGEDLVQLASRASAADPCLAWSLVDCCSGSDHPSKRRVDLDFGSFASPNESGND